MNKFRIRIGQQKQNHSNSGYYPTQPGNNHTDKIKDKVEIFIWEIKTSFKMKILKLITAPSKININCMGISVLPTIEEKISAFGDKSILII